MFSGGLNQMNGACFLLGRTLWTLEFWVDVKAPFGQPRSWPNGGGNLQQEGSN